MVRQAKLMLFTAGLSILTVVSAQDERVHPYMQAVSEQFKTDEGYEIQVDYIREDIMQKSSNEGEGTIWMKGIKYKMIVDEYIVYFDGVKLYSQNTDTEEVYVSTPDPEDAGISAVSSHQGDQGLPAGF